MNSWKKFDKSRLPHIIIEPHRIRKTHYRRCVAIMIVSGAFIHYMVPEHETWMNMATNLIWLFDPTEG